jgi:hypothetical protein
MSRRLAALRRDIELLRKQFLPHAFNNLGVYPDTDRVQAHTRAFLVLSHAEVESYIEEWAKDIARASQEIWKKTHRVALPVAFLLNWTDTRLRVAETLSAGMVGTQRLDDVLKKVFQDYYDTIKENHGVKEKNVLALFVPVGVDASAFTATLLPNLETLGSIRGTHAHHSSKSVASVLDPETEYERIETVLNDLDVLEQWLVAYRRKIR